MTAQRAPKGTIISVVRTMAAAGATARDIYASAPFGRSSLHVAMSRARAEGLHIPLGKRRPNRYLLDLPPAVAAAIEDQAVKTGLSAARVAKLWLSRAAKAHTAGIEL